MRIGIDARWNHHGGVAVYVSQLVNVLPEIAAKRGIELVVYEGSAGTQRQSHRNVQRVQISSGRYSPAAQFELAARARKDKLDLFHSPFYWMPFFINCPVLITIHDLMPYLFKCYGWAHQELVKAGYRAAAGASAHITANSEHTKRDIINLLQVPSRKITMVYHAVDNRDFYHPRSDAGELAYLQTRYGIEPPYVLTISSTNWRTKNLEGCLHSIERCRDRTSCSFQTVVMGNEIGLNQSGLRGSLRNAVVTGPVPLEDLPKLYRNAAVFLTLSHYEGFGRPLVEAMACGAPCIASTGGSLPEIAGDAAIVRDGNDWDGIAEALADLLEHPERRSSLSAKGPKRAAEFSLDRFAEQMIDLYVNVAQSCP